MKFIFFNLEAKIILKLVGMSKIFSITEKTWLFLSRLDD